MEERKSRGGDPRGPRGLCDGGVSLGSSAKLMDRLLFGSFAWLGRGEQGNTGLGSSMGEEVGDDDGEGNV